MPSMSGALRCTGCGTYLRSTDEDTLCGNCQILARCRGAAEAARLAVCVTRAVEEIYDGAGCGEDDYR
ncbi:hypothetical protein ACWDUL_23185 [Nocardia niigatensis]